MSIIESSTSDVEQNDKSASTALPVISSLDSVAIGTPCQMDWGLMDQQDEDQRVRFCQHCTKNVYNISAMKSDDAISLINQNEGELCLRYYKRSDGTIVTADCPPIKRRSAAVGIRRWFQFSIASLLALLTASAGFAGAAPWIKTKVQPLVDHWFPVEVEVDDDPALWLMGDVIDITVKPPILAEPEGELHQGGISAPPQ